MRFLRWLDAALKWRYLERFTFLLALLGVLMRDHAAAALWLGFAIYCRLWADEDA